MIMAFSQLQSQSFQSLQLVQSGHAFLDERHHPENKIQKKKKNKQTMRLIMILPAWLIHQLMGN